MSNIQQNIGHIIANLEITCTKGADWKKDVTYLSDLSVCVKIYFDCEKLSGNCWHNSVQTFLRCACKQKVVYSLNEGEI